MDCGPYNCSPGFKCATGGCIAADAVDCGNGHHCNAGFICSGNQCVSQADLDRQRERQEAEERKREQEAAAEATREREEERERAAAAREEAERAKRAAGAARQTREREEERTAALRALNAALEGCRTYIRASCDSALRSSVIAERDRTDVLLWQGVAEKFEHDQRQCEAGSIDACNAAIGSPAADAQDRERLGQLRVAASPWRKTRDQIAAFTVEAKNSVASLPLSTLIASAIAAVFGITLVVLLLRERRSKSVTLSKHTEVTGSTALRDAGVEPQSAERNESSTGGAADSPWVVAAARSQTPIGRTAGSFAASAHAAPEVSTSVTGEEAPPEPAAASASRAQQAQKKEERFEERREERQEAYRPKMDEPRPYAPPSAAYAPQSVCPHAKQGVGGATKVFAIILNIVLPGVGSFIVGKWGQGIFQLMLGFLGILLIIVPFIGLPLVIFVRIWAIITAATVPTQREPMQIVVINQPPPGQVQ